MGKSSLSAEKRKPLDILTDALRGIASCATECGCCRMHHSIAAAALINYDKALKESAQILSPESAPRE